MSNWLDNSNNANTLKSSYIEGFVDVSGGSIQIRNQSNKLSIQGDASFSNNVYLANTTKIGKRFERNVTSTTTKSLDVSGNVQISNGELITTGNTTIYNNARVNNLNVSGEFKNDNLPSVSSSDVTFNETINNTSKMAVNTSDYNYYTPIATSGGNPVYQSIHSDVDDSGTFSSDVSLNNSLKVPGNILIVDSSNSTYNYGAYTVYTTADNTNYFAMGKDASNVFNIVNNNHAGVYMSSGSNAFTSTSDERLKKNIEELDEEECIQKLKQLEPVTYQWKHNENGEKQAGFIAQEVEKVFPDLVSENTYPDGSTYKGVAMDDLIPYLLKYIQYLRKKLETIKANRSEHASISTNGGSITPLTSTDDLTRA